jgi:hypothetical protein
MKRALLLGLPLLACGSLHAQGGPPMATDDPGTPGDGHWEINLAAVGTHVRDGWNVDVPDADINYGLGDHIQLNLDLPWTFTNTAAGGHWQSGIGDASIAVKWRFLDAGDKHPIDLSIYPRYQTSLSGYSERIGVASPDKEFFLPIEMATKVQAFDIAADFGRHFVEHGASFWSGGVVVGHSCGSEKVECMAEIHREWGSGDAQTLLNFGLRWKLTDALTFLGALGREFGPGSDDQRRAMIYIGVQVSR